VSSVFSFFCPAESVLTWGPLSGRHSSACKIGHTHYLVCVHYIQVTVSKAYLTYTKYHGSGLGATAESCSHDSLHRCVGLFASSVL
jgi:hypothetical protein